MKIRPVGAELFHDANSHFSQICEGAWKREHFRAQGTMLTAI